MSDLVIFGNDEFGEIRITDQNGEPWFVLKDILNALGTSTPPHVAKASIEEVFGDGGNSVTPIQDSLGRMQDTTIINESAMTYLVAQSRTETGKKLNRWIHAEVLPAIRKTGKYEAPKADTKPKTLPFIRREFRAAQLMAKDIGLKDNDAIFSADWAIRNRLGESPLEILNVTHLISPTQQHALTPSDIGKELSMSSRKVNLLLTEMGYQTVTRDAKDRPVYHPTEKGKAFSRLEDTQKGRPGAPVLQLKWLETIVDALADDMAEEAA